MAKLSELSREENKILSRWMGAPLTKAMGWQSGLLREIENDDFNLEVWAKTHRDLVLKIEDSDKNPWRWPEIENESDYAKIVDFFDSPWQRKKIGKVQGGGTVVQAGEDSDDGTPCVYVFYGSGYTSPYTVRVSLLDELLKFSQGSIDLFRGRGRRK